MKLFSYYSGGITTIQGKTGFDLLGTAANRRRKREYLNCLTNVTAMLACLLSEIVMVSQ